METSFYFDSGKCDSAWRAQAGLMPMRVWQRYTHERCAQRAAKFYMECACSKIDVSCVGDLHRDLHSKSYWPGLRKFDSLCSTLPCPIQMMPALMRSKPRRREIAWLVFHNDQAFQSRDATGGEDLVANILPDADFRLIYVDISGCCSSFHSVSAA